VIIQVKESLILYFDTALLIVGNANLFLAIILVQRIGEVVKCFA